MKNVDTPQQHLFHQHSWVPNRTPVHAEEWEVAPGTSRVSRARESRDLDINIRLCSAGTCTVSQLQVAFTFTRYVPTNTDIPPGCLANQWYLMISYRQKQILENKKVSASHAVQHLHLTKNALRTVQ